jgi:cytochrome c553
MKVQRSLSALGMILLLSAAFVMSGCNDIATMARKVTYPPDFNYVSEQEFRSQMDQLAFQLQLLDRALVTSNSEPSIQQQQVLDALRNMERIGSSLQAGEAGSSHPFLQDFMKDFMTDVEKARTAAAVDPASYYRAGRIAGGCVNCHEVNR